MPNPIARNREKALLNLLGTTEIPDPRDYPSQLTLPDSMQESRNRIVAATDEDMFARTHSYRYRFGHWYGGLVLKGTRPYPDKKSGSIMVRASVAASFIGQLYRPHIALITHQNLTSEKAASVIKEAEERDFRPRSTPGNQPVAAYMMPSISEVGHMHENIGGSLGIMVASAGGTFLSVRHDMTNISVFEPMGPQRTRIEYAQTVLRRGYKEASELLSRQPEQAELARSIVLGATAQALEARYVCYFSSDPQAASLERINAAPER